MNTIKSICNERICEFISNNKGYLTEIMMIICFLMGILCHRYFKSKYFKEQLKKSNSLSNTNNIASLVNTPVVEDTLNSNNNNYSGLTEKRMINTNTNNTEEEFFATNLD